MPSNTRRLASSKCLLPFQEWIRPFQEWMAVNSSIDAAWEAAPSDPDSHADLDYELQPLTVIKMEKQTGGKYMILPGEEDHLHDEEFLVADPGSVCRLDECR